MTQNQDRPLPETSDQQIAADAQHLIVFIKASMMVLSHRAMTMLALLVGAGISVWAAAAPDMYRAIVAISWWPLCFWPALWAERKANG
jgi:uncharacterized membrane protein YwaF